MRMTITALTDLLTAGHFTDAEIVHKRQTLNAFLARYCDMALGSYGQEPGVCSRSEAPMQVRTVSRLMGEAEGTEVACPASDETAISCSGTRTLIIRHQTHTRDADATAAAATHPAPAHSSTCT